MSPDLVRAGYSSKRRLSPQEAALVIERQRDEIRAWASRYSHLWAAVDDFLTCLPSDRVAYMSRLRHEVGKHRRDVA